MMNKLLMGLVLMFSVTAFAGGTDIYRIVGNGVNSVFDIYVHDNCVNTDHFSTFKKTLDGKTLKLMNRSSITFSYDDDFQCVNAQVDGVDVELKVIEVEAVVSRSDLAYWSVDLNNGERLFITQSNLRNIGKSTVDTFQIGQSNIENDLGTISNIRAKVLD